MCIENMMLCAVCAHIDRSNVDYCRSFVLQTDVDICPDHRTYLTLEDGWCFECRVGVFRICPDRAPAVVRSLWLVDKYWRWHARRDNGLDADKPRLADLLVEDATQVAVDVDACRHWLETLRLKIASCAPEEVVVGGVLWPDNPWFVDDSRPDRQSALVRVAQLRAIRWVARLDPDAVGDAWRTGAGEGGEAESPASGST